MKKILIVDDEPNIVMTLEYAFKKKQYEVYIARDGKEALDIMDRQIPDAIILDIMMPEVDGYETLRVIKENQKLKDVKVIFLSAKNKATDVEKGLSMGADKYVTKPFSVKQLIGSVEDLICS